MAEESGNTSIAARIAALRLEQVGRQPGETPPPPPSVPNKRPGLNQRHQTTNVPPLGAHASTTDAGHDIGNLPAEKETSGFGGRASPSLPARLSKSPAPFLPPRRPSAQTPQLPPRRPSETPSRPDVGRKSSTESTSSVLSTRSSISTTSNRTGSSGALYNIRAPSYDPSSLPPLPPKKVPSLPERGQAPLQPNKSSPNVLPAVQEPARPQLPSRTSPVQAERLPLRPPLPARDSSSSNGQKATVPLPAKKSALSWGLNSATKKEPVIPARPDIGVPPPIHMGSRPDLSRLMASKPTNVSTNGAVSLEATNQANCLKCRDFSAVDAHAARFPRDAIPSSDAGWLAHQLTSPFHSLTDKARAIFVWLHHNINYDTEALYSGRLYPSTPASTIQTGLAVCEGYAGLFTGLASKMGLESMVIGGHGKGLGFQPVTPGAPLPREDATGHAWNAVKIDNGQWKLIDCCWGAGHSGGWGKPYERKFHPVHFWSTNEEFGRSHFPSNKNHFFRADGRSLTWAEYLLGNTNGQEAVQTFGNLTVDEGFDDHSVQPFSKQISVSDPRPFIRFQFNKICPHWDFERNGKGKPYVYILFIPDSDGKKGREVVLETNGQFWWVDVALRDLGEPGRDVKLGALTSWNGRDGRGIRPDEYTCGGGRAWGFAAIWKLVD